MKLLVMSVSKFFQHSLFMLKHRNHRKTLTALLLAKDRSPDQLYTFSTEWLPTISEEVFAVDRAGIVCAVFYIVYIFSLYLFFHLNFSHNFVF